MKNYQKVAENTKINAILNTRKQLLVPDKNIRIWDRLKHFWTPHVTRSTLMPSICKSELVWASYSLCKITASFLWNAFFALSFIMHYTEYFTMRHYAGFSQIGSHMCVRGMLVAMCIILYVCMCTYMCVYCMHIEVHTCTHTYSKYMFDVYVPV